MKTAFARILGVLALLAGCMCVAGESVDQGFQKPPPAARPWVYWFWMDGNISREGITADLEAMQRAGIGGMLIMEVDVGIPRGPVNFMSAEWRTLFKHAVTEAERLGLQITLNAGPGWTGSGGPWVKPEQSMQHLVASVEKIHGPANFNALLPRPKPRDPHFVHAPLPASLKQARDDFYQDVGVIAFPSPASGATIPESDEKALYYRNPYSSSPNVKAVMPTPAEYPILPAAGIISPSKIVDLTDRLQPDGRLAWEAPEGNWTIMRLGRTSTGANTRPAPAPGIGFECDKFDAAALDAHFKSYVEPLLREIGPRPLNRTSGWTMLHIDSWEMGAQNWTARFREEFKRRRGYDPLPYLPAMTGRVVGSLEASERFLWDIRQTAQELVIENHALHLKALGKPNGLGLSIEPYDLNPCSDLSLGGAADVPMCEFWAQGYGFNTSFSCIEASSIAHTRGRQIVAAESFTSGDNEAWRLFPGNMKIQGDWALCAGINRVVFHRYAHQPWLDRWPGMTMGPYGVHYERTQTWWEMSGAWHEYLARCQYMLRRGLPVADICYLAAEGAPHVFRPPASAMRGSAPVQDRRGYNFDGCAPETLIDLMTVKNGKLTLPDGMSYRVLVLPDMETMRPELLRKVQSLARAGATIIGQPPRKSPSLSGFPKCDEEVQRIAAEMWGRAETPTTKGRAYGRGIIYRSYPEMTGATNRSPRSSLENAKWIWHREGNPAASAPVAWRYFQRDIVLESGDDVVSARVEMTADNAFELFVNGQAAGSGDNFTQISSFDISSSLHPGANRLSVAAQNGGDTPNPAGLIGCLTLRTRKGQERVIPTDALWASVDKVSDGWQTGTNAALVWQPAMELGKMNMSPWNLSSRTPQPDLYATYDRTAAILREMEVLPEIEADSRLRAIHRHDGLRDIYFLANSTDKPLATDVLFRTDEKSVELWDPVTGQRHSLPRVQPNAGRVKLHLEFQPAQSYFIVFGTHSPGAQPLPQEIAKTAAALPGPWKVAFDPQRGGPREATFDRLIDWTQRPEEGIQHYSGVATYRTTFDAPARVQALAWSVYAPAAQARLFLDLGTVHELARVRLNGRDLGVVWCAPWRVEITGTLRAKDNQLEIEVANLWVNRLIGDQQAAQENRITKTTWTPYKKDSKLLPSGLFGPVTIQEMPVKTH